MKDVEGAYMIEYAIIASLTTDVAIGAITSVITSVNSTFNSVGNQLTASTR